MCWNQQKYYQVVPSTNIPDFTYSPSAKPGSEQRYSRTKKKDFKLSLSSIQSSFDQ